MYLTYYALCHVFELKGSFSDCYSMQTLVELWEAQGNSIQARVSWVLNIAILSLKPEEYIKETGVSWSHNK